MFRSLTSLFSDVGRAQAEPQASLPELNASELALVSGGLPRVGGGGALPGDEATNNEPNDLPRVGGG